MKTSRKFVLFGAALAFLLGIAGTLRAQTATGEITGTVTDTSGAVVPQVKVTVTNQQTNSTRETMTNDAGAYTVTLLPVGVYTISAQKTGFRIAKQTDITLNVAQTIRTDLQLAVGEMTQTVEVTGAGVLLDTDTSAVSQVVNNRQVSELPLNSRNFVDFLLLGAGAVDRRNGEQAAMRQDKGGSYSINGARPTSLNYTLDGVINTDVALNTPAVILSQDGIQEFNEQTETYSAAYGFSANQVNIVSKSGTNQLHGSVFEFLRNDALDARNTFAASKPVLRQNQFGFVAGGPVYIPKVYDGRNKSFWLVNYEGWRIHRGDILQASLPDPTTLTGDFSGSGLPAFGTAACSTNLTKDLPCMPIDPQTGLPFTSNMIPSSRFSKLAKETLALKMFPTPNCDPAVCSGNNFKALVTLPTTFNQQTYRGDQDLGRYGKVFGRVTRSNFSSTTLGTATLPLGNNNFIEKETDWMISHTITLGGWSVNNFRFARLKATANQCGTPAPQSDIDALGFTGVFPNLPDCARSYPGGIGIAPFSDVGGPTNDTTLSYIPTWEADDSFSTIRGNHSLSIGADYRQWVQNRNLAADFLGTFTYRSDLVLVNGTGCPTPECGTGNAAADFLLGYYQNTGIFQPAPFSKPGVAGNLNQYHFQYFAPYVQDDWKVRPNLTLNLGLRWDFRTVPFEQSNKMGWLDVTNPLGGLCIADQSLVTKGVAPPGNGFYRYCGRRNPADSSKDVFAPRIGFAWRPFGGDKTVVRGGYGVFFDSAEGREIDDSGDIFPYEVRSILSPATQPVASSPKLTDQLYPAFTTIKPVSPDAVTFIAVIISERPRNPYVQQWSFSVQRQLAANTTLEANYLGNKGTHLLARTEIAQANRPSNPDFCSAQDASGNYINLNNGDCPVAARRPYPNFTGVYIDSEWQGISNYNAANIKLERRTSNLSMQAIYTWSKSLDNKSAAAGIGNAVAGWNGFMDNHHPNLDYGLSDFDVGSRFVANFLYQLPVGRGQQYLASSNKAADAVLGGWRLGGIVTLQGGFPFSVYGQDPFGLNDVIFGFGNRADRVPNQNPFPSGTKTTKEWFNTAAFSQPKVAHFGDTSRNFLRGPSFSNFDLSLAKTFSITEYARMEFRVETFNSFNHAIYDLPDTSMSDTTYGQISGTAHDARELQFGLKFLF
ncbi:MAG: hypothetical protein DMG22_06935 [Acidobacteria bacterium]|nr:MAG: hypothetical protein DMG22_06935 [Acidobacteriota bacterium]